jgi:hypothetical protein
MAGLKAEDGFARSMGKGHRVSSGRIGRQTVETT